MWTAFTEENQMDLFCLKKALITYRKSTQLPKNITPHTAESTNIKGKKCVTYFNKEGCSTYLINFIGELR